MDENIIITHQHFLLACNEVKSQFAHQQNLQALVPIAYSCKPDYIKIRYDIMACLALSKPIKSVILHSKPKLGKTILMVDVLIDVGGDYKYLLSSRDIIGMTDDQKCGRLIEIFEKAYMLNTSMIVIDDLEILLNYATLGNSVIYSNKIFQTLLSLIKTAPPHRDFELSVVLICYDDYLTAQLRVFTDFIFKL